MDNMIENTIGTAFSSLTPWGCARNCVSLLMVGAVLYVILVVVFVFVQGGL